MPKANDAKKPKTKKALKLSSEKQILALTISMSVLVGLVAVLANRAMNDISFNNQIINAKNDSIVAYNKLIRNVGICKDKNGDGKYDENELKDCDPNTVAPNDVPGSLRSNVMNEIAQNSDLESVGRESLSLCYGSDGKRINFVDKQNTATTEKEKLLYIDLTKKCSAIRVISDALPSTPNETALLASLNKIMLLSSWQPDRISQGGEAVPVDINGIGFIPMKFSAETKPETIYSLIENIERSIRNIDINRASITWSASNKTEFSVRATAYYAEQEQYQTTTKTITPQTGKKSQSSKKSSDKKQEKK